MMKIDFLYFKGCEHSAPALRRLFDVLDAEDLIADVNQVDIITESDAQRYHFLGSPTIQIDGVDIELEARNRTAFGLMCRTYPDGSGVPPVDMITRAVREHAKKQ